MTITNITKLSERNDDLALFPFPVAEGTESFEATANGEIEDIESPDADLTVTFSAELLLEYDDMAVQAAMETVTEFDLDDAIGAYLRSIGKMALLSAEEEVDLAKLMESGRAARNELLAILDTDEVLSPESKNRLSTAIQAGNDARDTLIKHNTRLAVSVARRYNNRGVDLDDLIQEGNVGLTRATERFDYHRGWRFSTYATWWVRQSVTRAVANQARTIRVPVHANDWLTKLAKATAELKLDGVQNPSLDQIAKKLVMAPNKVLEIIELTSRVILSLDSPIKKNGEDNGSNLEDIIPGDPNEVEDKIDSNLLREIFEAVFDQLDPTEYRVLKLRFGFDEPKACTLDEIADRMCIGREAVRYIEGKALRAFRQPSIRNRLSAFI